MSIELKITAADTADLRTQLAALLGTTAPVTSETVVYAATATTEKPKVEKPKAQQAEPKAEAPKVVEAAAETPVPQPEAAATSAPTAEPSPPTPTSASTDAGSATSATPSPSDDGVLDYDRDVTPRVLAFAQKFGRDGVMDLLKPFDVVNAKHIVPAKWPELLSAIDDRFAQAA